MCTGSSILLKNLATIVDKCAKFASHIKIVNMQTEQYNSLKLHNDLKQSMIDGYKKVQEALVDKVSEELQEKISPLDNDDNNRLKMSLDLLSNWMSKGLEIHPSIESLPEIKDLFPTKEEQAGLLKGQTPRLKDKNKE